MAMDDIPLFSPAGRAYLSGCRKRLMLISMVSESNSDEDFAKISAALLGDDSAAMDDIPFLSPAGVQAWLASHYLMDQQIGAQRRRSADAAPSQ
jgi:hypothetical protein